MRDFRKYIELTEEELSIENIKKNPSKTLPIAKTFLKDKIDLKKVVDYLYGNKEAVKNINSNDLDRIILSVYNAYKIIINKAYSKKGPALEDMLKEAGFKSFEETDTAIKNLKKNISEKKASNKPKDNKPEDNKPEDNKPEDNKNDAEEVGSDDEEVGSDTEEVGSDDEEVEVDSSGNPKKQEGEKISKNQREMNTIDYNKFPSPAKILKDIENIEKEFEDELKGNRSFEDSKELLPNYKKNFAKKISDARKKLNILNADYNKFSTRNKRLSVSTKAKNIITDINREKDNLVSKFEASSGKGLKGLKKNVESAKDKLSQKAKDISDSNLGQRAREALKKGGTVASAALEKGKEIAGASAEKAKAVTKDIINSIKSSSQAKFAKENLNKQDYKAYLRKVADFKTKNDIKAKQEAEAIYQKAKVNFNNKRKGTKREKIALSPQQLKDPDNHRFVKTILGPEKGRDYLLAIKNKDTETASKLIKLAKTNQTKSANAALKATNPAYDKAKADLEKKAGPPIAKEKTKAPFAKEA
jgi:hypothetical protein